ncbi:MAG: ABC transporter substrate-binding protein [Burkholderiales bacterium]
MKPLSMIRWMARLGALLCMGMAGLAQGQSTKFVFLTNWLAQAEHGGFYQAVAEGTYRRHGLEVEVRMGGPQINVLQLLLAGQVDAAMGYDLQVIKGIEQGLPLVTVGATFQKDPVVLIAHPPASSLRDLKSRTLLIGQASETTFWPWAKTKYGFTDEQKRPYAFSVQPFLVDKNVVQQGYATSEPYSIEKAGVKPVVFLLADEGYPPYAQTIVVLERTLKEKPAAIKQFLQATAEGYKSYLANPAPGNGLIKKANPEMEDALLAFGLQRIKDYELVTGGDAKKLGILTMSDARWKQTFEFMVSAGLVKPSVDYKKAYSLDLVKQIKVIP